MRKLFCLNCAKLAVIRTMVNGLKHCDGCGGTGDWFVGSEGALLLRIASEQRDSTWKRLATQSVAAQVQVHHN